MMRELIIITEGSTEEEFVKNSIRPYLFQFGIHTVTPIRISSSPGHKGGLRTGSFQKLKNDAQRYLHQMDDVIVSTLIDYYHLPVDFPEYHTAMSKPTSEDKVGHLEKAMESVINHKRFIGYIQLHEFEAILYSKIDGFREIPEITDNQLEKIQSVINSFSTPEEINDGIETSPSNRLIKIIPNYRKKLYGSYITLVNGFNSILETCPRFKNWIETLIKVMVH